MELDVCIRSSLTDVTVSVASNFVVLIVGTAFYLGCKHIPYENVERNLLAQIQRLPTKNRDA